MMSLFMAYCVFRFHHGKQTRWRLLTRKQKLEWWLTVATAVGVM